MRRQARAAMVSVDWSRVVDFSASLAPGESLSAGTDHRLLQLVEATPVWDSPVTDVPRIGEPDDSGRDPVGDVATVGR
jgi:hypothetical protein